MKSFFLSIPLILLILGSASAQPKTQKTSTIPCNKAYIEPWKENNPDIRGGGGRRGPVCTIVGEESRLAWYPVISIGGYELFVEMALPKGEKSKLQAVISSPENPDVATVEREIELTGTGEFERISLGNLEVRKKAYYRIALIPVSKTGEEFAKIRNLLFDSPGESQGEVHATEYLTSPSVHLWIRAEDADKEPKREFDWLYGEIQVPEGFDPMYTYYMSIGFVRGYFGIQVNSATDRRVLFSIWDSSDEEIDRAKVKDEDRVQLIDKGEDVYAGSFGNEGTGGQSYWKYPWKTGQRVRFLMNARRLPGDFVAYSAWFMDEDAEGWKYMATWKAPKENRVLDGFYSFLENFGQGNGQEVRQAYYSNYWGREVGGDWIEMPDVRVTHTDGTPEGRRDYGGGKAPDQSNRFYMESGGYTGTNDQRSASVKKTNVRPPVDLDVLNAQIDRGFEKYEAKRRQD